MIHHKLTTSDTIDILNEIYGRFDLNTTRTFYKGSDIIGFADYFIVDKKLFLKNLRVTKSRTKFGSLIIVYLFDSLCINAIHGYSINAITDCFWMSLGATFYKTEKDSFILYRDNMKND